VPPPVEGSSYFYGIYGFCVFKIAVYGKIIMIISPPILIPNVLL